MRACGKYLAGGLALFVAAGALSTQASANNGNNGAFLGGLAVGVIGSAIVNGAANNNGYGYQPSGYYSAPVYNRRRCWFVSEPVYGLYGQVVGEQRVRQCNY